MEPVSCVILLILVEAVLGEPKAQGQYQGAAQFAAAGGAQPVQLQFAQTKQILQPQYLTAQQATPAVFEGQNFYTPQFIPQAAQPIQQVILPSNVDRQVRQ